MPKKFKRNADDEERLVGELVETSTVNYIKVTDSIPAFQNNTIVTDSTDTKAIKAIERLIRGSLEYRNYFQYLKNNLDMRRCTYLPNLQTGLYSMHIELHHTPFTLYDLTETVVIRHIQDHGSALEFDVASEVMELHYANVVGLIPLSPTVHELVHSESMDVNPNLVYGNWKDYAQRYRPYFSEASEEKYSKAIAFDGVDTTRIPEVLKVKYTLLQYEGIPLYKPLALEDTSSLASELL